MYISRNEGANFWLSVLTDLQNLSLIHIQMCIRDRPIRERRNIGSGYGEIAQLGDAYQMSIDRLSELQDLIEDVYKRQDADIPTDIEHGINIDSWIKDKLK